MAACLRASQLKVRLLREHLMCAVAPVVCELCNSLSLFCRYALYVLNKSNIQTKTPSRVTHKRDNICLHNVDKV
jgi:tRNA U54 and U55 pseudouridine synthase Pus10